ncbi:xanthine dehydrogenase accessory protein XdhC [Carnimonas bestiolae]|uniref:xanthine dehydrogenase accessory protein XdhC n=1 Tax=Carnimonas bestiolae TaxID=3402172 RepID=UPI003EDBF84F
MNISDTAHWSCALAQLQQQGTAHVLVSLLSCAGSTPREPGSKMVVTLDDTFDTLGGGNVEYQLIARARAMLSNGERSCCLERLALGVQANQCCGGHVAVLLEPFAGASMQIALFGAGHVGTALQQLMTTLPWRVDWYDSRASAVDTAAQQAGPRTRVFQLEGDPAAHRLAPHSHCVVMTHDHSEDERLIEYLLQQPHIASIGLIGSATKWARFRHRLKARGFSDAQLDSVRCPIASAAIGHKLPAEIALGIAAELLTLAPGERETTTLRGLAHADLETITQLLNRTEQPS